MKVGDLVRCWMEANDEVGVIVEQVDIFYWKVYWATNGKITEHVSDNLEVVC